MKQTMSAAEFCRYTHEHDQHTFICASCNQAPDDDTVQAELVFRAAAADPSVKLLSLRGEGGSLYIQNVQSVTVDTDYTVLGDYVVIHAVSPLSGRDIRVVLVAR